MVHLHTIGHVSHTTSAILKLIGYEAYLMAAFNQALTQLIPMGLYATELREGKVSAY